MNRAKLLRVLFFLLLLLSLSCINKREETGTSTNNMKQTEEQSMKQSLPSNCLILDTLSFPGKQPLMDYLKRYKQDIINEGGDATDVIFIEDELHYIFPLVDFWLKKGGFVALSDEAFRSRVKEIYNIDILHPHTKIEKDNNYYLFISDVYTEPYGPHLGYTYFIKNGNFIFRPTLSEDLAKETENGQYYTCFKPSLLHQNKFLFNESNASLTWLINNDIEFLEMLIKDFGYDKNDKLNKAVLDHHSSKYFNEEDPRKRKFPFTLFARKLSDGAFRINENLMKFISENYTEQVHTPIGLMVNYAGHMIRLDADNKDNSDFIANNFTQEERFKLAAYAGYYELLAREINDIDNIPEYEKKWYSDSSLGGHSLINNPEFLEEIKRNNYYDLPGLEDRIDIILKIASGELKDF